MNLGLLPKLGQQPIQGHGVFRFGASAFGAQTTNPRWRSLHLKAVQ